MRAKARRNRRDLPWRAPPGETPDPYAVWLSEIMLQQTTVAAAKPYFAAFLSRWPHVEALAKAPLDEAMKAWAGLGYYARARNMHACAGLVATKYRGRFPTSELELRELPGVGPYTAAAIAAIAFNRPAIVVDGNIQRVVARLFAVSEPPRQARTRIAELLASLLSPERPGDFAQGLMDLGAGVCTARAPSCGACPFAGACEAARRGEAEAFPVKAPRTPKPNRKGAAFVLRCAELTLLRTRPPRGLLGAMTEFPTTPFEEDFDVSKARAMAPLPAKWRLLDGDVEHVFTHFRLELAVFIARVAPPVPRIENYRWAPARDLDREGLPTLMRKVAVHAGLIRSGSARKHGNDMESG
ncbi:MAG: A/G-specific adenine glycosylase [Methylocystis sp.]|nr:A/G-specific adenine glycosylase [Methylocystis sp.]